MTLVATQPLVVRRIRAQFTDSTVRVYQSLPRETAEASLAVGTLVPPFNMGHMTWIKPGFLGMLLRWQLGAANNQHTLLAIDVKRAAFEWLLANSCVNSYQPDLHASRDAWAQRMAATSIRTQWDQEKSILQKPLPYRSLQIGLSGETLESYVDDWIVGLTSCEGLAHWISSALKAKRYVEAAAHLPVEEPYPLPPEFTAAIGVAP